jgi:hypothetical protein
MTGLASLLRKLVEEGRLSAPPHPDHRVHLARNIGKSSIAPREMRLLGLLGRFL